MDTLAFILAILAIAIFLLDFADRVRRPYTTPRWPSLVPLGLAILTGAWICQVVHAVGSTVG